MLVWRGLQLGLIMYAVILITSWHDKGIIFEYCLFMARHWRVTMTGHLKPCFYCWHCRNICFCDFINACHLTYFWCLFLAAYPQRENASFNLLMLLETIFTPIWYFHHCDGCWLSQLPLMANDFWRIMWPYSALAIGLNFVLLRKHDDLPIPAIIGNGSLLSGILGLLIVGPSTLFEGNWVMISICGLIILPVSFYCLTSASRYTAAANIHTSRFFDLLETILGPIWVWLGVGEAPTTQMIIGGVIVVIALAVYVIYSSMRLIRTA